MRKKSKILNSLDILMVAFGAMIGWGWVVSSGGWINHSGVLGTIIGFIIGGIVIYFVGLIYAELSTNYPDGGCLKYTKEAFGSGVSFVCTWIMILGYIGVVCFEACSLPTIIAYLFPNFLQGYMYTIAGFKVYATWLALSIVFTILITLVNIKGIKSAILLQNLLTLVVAVVGITLMVSSGVSGNLENLNEHLFTGDNFGRVMNNIFSIAIISPFFLLGFDVIPQTMVDVNVNLKKVGKMLILSIILAVSFYSLISLALGYALNEKELEDALNASGLAPAEAMTKIFKSDIAAKVMIIGGLCGVLSAWNSFLIGGSRTIYSLAKEKMIQGCFEYKSKKYGTPVWAIVLIGIITIISPFFGRSMLSWIVDASSFSCCFAYLIVSMSYFKIKRNNELNGEFKNKHWKFISIFSIISLIVLLCFFFVPKNNGTIKYEGILIFVIWLILGLVLYFINKRKTSRV